MASLEAGTIETAKKRLINGILTHVILQCQSAAFAVNPLIATLKLQSNGPSYSNTVIGTLAVDGWL